tara:strand:+ start:12551 stop:13021 length:471 start_codon:yes stop_codon:yes gene_type:complete
MFNGKGVNHGDASEVSPYYPLYTQYKAAKQRAKRRTQAGEPCKVTMSYLEFKAKALSEGWTPENRLYCLRNGDKGDYSLNNCRFGTAKENSIESEAKHYTFINPDGNLVEVFNLKEYCRQNNLSDSKLCEVHSGKRKQYKGWVKFPVGLELDRTDV